MAGVTSLDAVKRKIKSLQDQADQAEERAEQIQKELLAERKAREQVSMNDLWPKSKDTSSLFVIRSTVLLKCC